jgi:hypothetical protein
MKRLWLAVAIGIMGMVAGSSLAWGQAHAPLQYHGGPVLRTFGPAALIGPDWVVAGEKRNEGL